MAFSLPNGSVIAIASAYAASKAMSALTNANPGVATLEAAHGVVDGDFMEITSGWSKLNGRIVRADNVATNDVDLEGVDTSSTTLYPAASGTGSIREISTWQNLPQIMEPASEGGEQQFTDFQFLEDSDQRSLPTVRSAQGFTMRIADDPTLAVYTTLETADQDRVARAFRVTLPSGAIIVFNAYVSFNPIPNFNVNQVMSTGLSLRFAARPMRYAS